MRFSIIVFTIFFGILSFAPNMQGGQFFKLKEVIEHFEQHQETKNSFSSFFAFVKDHYFKENQDGGHNQLPFKTSIASVVLLVIQDNRFVPVYAKSNIETITVENNYPETFGYLKGKSISIWNPPQV